MDDLRNRPAWEVFEDHPRTVKEWSYDEDRCLFGERSWPISLSSRGDPGPMAERRR